ncbi:MAG: hypothetical protein P8Y10_13955 [Gemmatimonadales bacterium]|jgi:hypothetical protein
MRDCRLAVGWVLVAVACGQPGAPTLEEIVARHAEARGGTAEIERIESLEVGLRISEPTFDVEARYRATRDGRMRIDVFADSVRVFTEAHDSVSGWQLGAGEESEPVEMSPAGEEAVKRGVLANLFGLHEWQAQGYALTLRGREEIDDTGYWVIDAVAPDGFAQRLYLDEETYLIARKRDRSALHPDVDPEEEAFETIFGDFRAVDGVVFSFAEQKQDLRTGEVAQSVVVKELIVNPDIDPSIFTPPGPVSSQ